MPVVLYVGREIVNQVQEAQRVPGRIKEEHTRQTKIKDIDKIC